MGRQTLRQKIGPKIAAVAARLGIFIGGRKELYRVKAGTARVRDAKLYETLQVKVETIFDIGANVGHITAEYRQNFPEAAIYAFEPGNSTYPELAARFGSDPKTFLRQEAISDQDGEVCFNDLGDELSHVSSGGIGRKVSARSVDSLCVELDIERISILKIDTEGHDLDVLRGTERMLREGRVDTVIAEFGIAENKVPLDLITEFLASRGYPILLTFDYDFWDNGLPGVGNGFYVREEILRRFPSIETRK